MMKQPVRTSMSDFIKSSMGSQFVIPVYQRNYTWNPENETTRFINDIEDLLEKKTDHHFLGILIYIESEVMTMFKELQIVDGQQRLTTSFIFLLCLKRLALEKKEKGNSVYTSGAWRISFTSCSLPANSSRIFVRKSLYALYFT